jgi:hypothetical protein
MAGPQSISVKTISAAAKVSAAKAIEQRKQFRLPTPYTLGYLPPWWWCGIIWRDPLGPIALGEAETLAAEVHAGIAAQVPAVKSSKPGVLTAGGFTTIGFAPPIEISVVEE